MVDPVLAAALFFAAICVPVWIAASAHPRPRRRRSGQDYGAMAEVEESDIGQMIEGINERRRRNGRAEIGDELVAELRREARTRER